MEIEVAVAKAGKWAVSESGDTLEMIERPHGGMSFVLVDGQRSGRAAKAISNLVARKAVSELAEGVRDGAAARAANDYLYTHRGGRVSATLNILSVDLVSGTLVLSRNSQCPTIVVTPDEGLRLLDEPSQPVGVRRSTKPQITELPLVAGTIVVVYTDGLEAAGARSRYVFDVPAAVREIVDGDDTSPQRLADDLLERALALDDGRPRDDVSVLVLRVVDRASDGVRRLALSLPL
ncbi:MAG: PP2C family protein-serine/threonine phosphatase [Chloroflexota bacterium]|nr:PP2C family protein-serine/threonine phosphatase [Chloroflexota bacterium]